ncbi:BTAD domain-containing putative transcriptional regulator [Kribbella sp. NPDC006257]|uniref:BTAD domain-containing putative transcriptional regulator n=1 Tax=Kribbella sp. NPDC006257 TaxID=3156738 RepID=UPI0033B46CD7
MLSCRVLGPIEVEFDGEPVEISGAVPRRLLAGLTTSTRPVPNSELAELVWPGEPPSDPAGALRVVVSRLRTALGPAARDHLVRTGQGYQLVVPVENLDHRRFVTLVTEAAAAFSAGEPAVAVRRYQSGLALWRGHPWPELDGSPAIAGFQARLEELHAVAVEESAAAQLATGDSASVVPVLREAVAAGPYRERRRELLALALYRSGRQTDALAELRAVRDLLDTELGVEPGPVLRDLERRMLLHDPTLMPDREPVAAPPRSAPAQPGFVGRSADLEALTDLLPTGGFALITGEPGIGKSSLLAELARIACAHGRDVVSVRTVEGTQPFWTWQEVVRQWTAVADQETRRQLIDPDGEFGAVFRPGRSAVQLTAERRFALFDRFDELLAASAATRGLVILLDDLQWADSASLALLSQLAKRRRSADVLIVAAARSAEFLTRSGAPELQALISRHGRHLALDGLSASAVEELLTGLTDQPVDSGIVASIIDRTAGNPLFVTELGRRVLTGDDGVPEVIRDAIRQHLHSLPAGCRRTLAASAVVGGEIDLVTTGALIGRPVAQILADLEQALGIGVVTRQGTTFGFRHDLLREVLAADLPMVERAALHLRIAEYREATTPLQVSEIARHRLAALPLGRPEEAAAAAEAAALAATAGMAWEDAAELYEQAIVVAADSWPSADRSRLLLGAGRSWYVSGFWERGIDRCTDAAELARRAGDAEALGRAALALPEAPDFRWIPLVRTWCEAALAGLPPEDSPLRAQLLAQQSLAAVFDNNEVRMAALSETALEMAERIKDDGALRMAYRARQLARSTPDGWADRLDLGSRMRALGERAGDLDAVAWGGLWSFDALVQIGRSLAAEEELRRLGPVLDRLGDDGIEWNVARSRAAMVIARGRFAEGRELWEAIRRSVHAGELASSTMWVQHPAQVSTLTGDDFDLEAVLPPNLDHPLRVASVFSLVVPWLVAHGRIADAEQYYRELPDRRDIRLPVFIRMSFEALRGWAAAEFGDEDGARHAYAALEPNAELHVCAGAGIGTILGSTQYYLGVTAAACGQTEQAVQHLRAAVESNERAGYEPLAALSRWRLARALLDRQSPGDSAEARQLADVVRATAERLGMAPLLADMATRMS